ncbi:universal stress protein [bacterium]|nr:universal stress protein [bacterium]
MVNIKKILIPTDFSENSKIALPFAVDLARKYGAELHILHVFDEQLLTPIFYEVGGDPKKYFEKLRNEFDAAVNSFLSGIDTNGIKITSHITSGTPFVEIIRYAREKGIDLIVMGTHGRSGIAHMFLGSVTEKVLRKAECPVMVIRNPELKFEKP